MKNKTTLPSRPLIQQLRIAVVIFFVSVTTTPAFAQATTAIGTAKVWGTVDGIAIEGVVQGPSVQVSDLQVACVFEYTEGDIFKSPPALPPALNGLVHLDQDMKGLLTEIRKGGKFLGHANETLLLTPPKGTIGGRRLLLIGLGDRNKFTPELMTGIGSVAMREALKLGVTSFSFASDLKDAGIDSPTALVAGNVVKGIFEAYRAQLWLKEKQMVQVKPISKVILLAGPAFFTTAGEGIQEAVSAIKN
ncbi:M17 family peptidase N-terminal domain-containing protein [Pedobacter sp. BMA]|uniref:M17 family peptidase N-terminal domain-containing protein n=1 Tax=Pedobacter sp. BMA TaxID=1663685 RepID=UPI00069D98B1|nr:M17 family peptidase N-terminal domain-containing protein [Pedobacter sp. BMA]